MRDAFTPPRVKAKKLIVHLGLAKTGTTILQESFFAHRQGLLAEHRMLYPSCGANHFHFHSVVSAEPETLLQIRREGISDREAARARSRGFLDAFHSEVEVTQPETILISSEYFSAMSPDEHDVMVELFENYAEEVQAIMYVRDPWSHAVSIVQQHIRDGKCAAPVKPGYARGQAAMVRRYECLFGHRLMVRPFFGGSGTRTEIVSDFCSAIGIPQIEKVQDNPHSSNIAIGRVKATLLAEMNRIWPQFDADGHFALDFDRDRMFRLLVELPIEDVPLRLSRRRAEIIRTLAREDLAYLEQRFFDGRPLFSEYAEVSDFEDFDDVIALETVSAEKLAPVIRAMIETLRQYTNDGSRLP